MIETIYDSFHILRGQRAKRCPVDIKCHGYCSVMTFHIRLPTIGKGLVYFGKVLKMTATPASSIQFMLDFVPPGQELKNIKKEQMKWSLLKEKYRSLYWRISNGQILNFILEEQKKKSHPVPIRPREWFLSEIEKAILTRALKATVRMAKSRLARQENLPPQG